jgi:hypothetical protein
VEQENIFCHCIEKFRKHFPHVTTSLQSRQLRVNRKPWATTSPTVVERRAGGPQQRSPLQSSPTLTLARAHFSEWSHLKSMLLSAPCIAPRCQKYLPSHDFPLQRIRKTVAVTTKNPQQTPDLVDKDTHSLCQCPPELMELSRDHADMEQPWPTH